jgi:hypothetical protein
LEKRLKFEKYYGNKKKQGKTSFAALCSQRIFGKVILKVIFIKVKYGHAKVCPIFQKIFLSFKTGFLHFSPNWTSFATAFATLGKYVSLL